MTEKSTEADGVFRDGLNCAQAVLSVFGPLHGVEKDRCFRIAFPFGAGMARRQETCGAVSGALMDLGLMYGRGIGEGDEAKERGYDKAQAFLRRFEELHGTVRCIPLQGADINTDEDMEKIREGGLFISRCARFVRDAVEIVESLAEW
ncbi:MAG: C_GCAxxG_C_C family protein [Spirochaetes bacterium]|nr:C_GCAxxG_C_C family protein [Spirochaetota bacterium]